MSVITFSREPQDPRTPTKRELVSYWLSDGLFAAEQIGKRAFDLGKRAIAGFSEWSAGYQVDPEYARQLGANATTPAGVTAEALEAFSQLSVEEQDMQFAMADAMDPTLGERVFCLTSEQGDLARARVDALSTQPGYTPVD